MNDMGTTLIVWAAILGAIAAGSMVLGAIVGITTPMSNNTCPLYTSDAARQKESLKSLCRCHC